MKKNILCTFLGIKRNSTENHSRNSALNCTILYSTRVPEPNSVSPVQCLTKYPRSMWQCSATKRGDISPASHIRWDGLHGYHAGRHARFTLDPLMLHFQIGSHNITILILRPGLQMLIALCSVTHYIIVWDSPLFSN